VSCIMPCEHSSYCSEADITNWPFYSAKCTQKYMSRTKSLAKLNFVSQSLKVDSEKGANSRSFELTSAVLSISNETNDLAIYTPEPKALYSVVNLSFGIKRYSKELVHQVLIPAILLILCNIFILVMDADLIERWVLYAIMLFSHYMFNLQLKWILPSTDSVPNVYVYFCDSQIITTILMLQSIMFKILIEDDEGERTWIRTAMECLEKSTFGKIIISQEKNILSNENPTSVDEAFKKPMAMRNFSRLIDRLLIIILVVLYAFMYSVLMPRDNASAASNTIAYESDY
jgi:hypothetical protein